jgi:hypothetical protein
MFCGERKKGVHIIFLHDSELKRWEKGESGDYASVID